MAAETLDGLEAIRAALADFASARGWCPEDFVISVEDGQWGDYCVRFAAREWDNNPELETINKEVWDYLRSRAPVESGRISLFGAMGLNRFRMIYADTGDA